MTSSVLRASAAVVAGMVLAGGPVGPADAAGAVEGNPEAADIDRFAEEYVDRHGLAGVSVAVVRDGSVVHTAGYGNDSTGAEVTSGTLMQVASLTKSITAMAVMRLVEDDLVDLDAPVQGYVPEFDSVDPRAERITVRQLLNHTSGMTAGGLTTPHRRAKETLPEAVESLAAMELGAEPGERHEYFNGNYWMLAGVVEAVSGDSYQDYLDAEVFGPLGMDASVAVEDDNKALAEVDGFAPGHVAVYGVPVPRDEPSDFTLGSGGVITTADDMARWLAPFTNEGRTAEGDPFVSADTVEEILTPSDPEESYALGWRNVPDDDRMAHSGTQFGYLSYQTIAGEGTLGVAVLSNTLTSTYDTAQPLAVGIVDLMEGRSPELTAPNHQIVDAVLAGLTLLTVALGLRRLRHADAWGARLAGRPVWRPTARLLPRFLPLALILGFVAVGIASQADATLVVGIGVGTLPSFTVWVVLAAVLNVATVAVRVRSLRAARARQRSHAHQP